MYSLLILALLVLVIQIVIFFVTRARKRRLIEPSETERKFGIKNRADAWKALHNQDLSETDRIEIEDLYKKL